MKSISGRIHTPGMIMVMSMNQSLWIGNEIRDPFPPAFAVEWGEAIQGEWSFQLPAHELTIVDSRQLKRQVV